MVAEAWEEILIIVTVVVTVQLFVAILKTQCCHCQNEGLCLQESSLNFYCWSLCFVQSVHRYSLASSPGPHIIGRKRKTGRQNMQRRWKWARKRATHTDSFVGKFFGAFQETVILSQASGLFLNHHMPAHGVTVFQCRWLKLLGLTMMMLKCLDVCSGTIWHAGLCPKPEQVAVIRSIYLGRDEFTWLPTESADPVFTLTPLAQEWNAVIWGAVFLDGIKWSDDTGLVFTWRTTVDVYVNSIANVATNIINENT